MTRLVLALALFGVACSAATPASTVTTTPATPLSTAPTATATTDATITPDLPEKLRGVALSPRSFEADDFDEFWDRAEEAGSLVLRVGGLDELGDPRSAFAATAVEAGSRGLGSVVVASSGSPLSERTVDAYIFDLLRFLDEHEITFLGIGNEVNRLGAPEYDDFVLLFDRLAASVDSVAPGTIVFPVLQYEWLTGHRDGLFGDLQQQPVWDVVDDFPAAEAIGFTTYPGLVFEDPTAVPDDYYTAAADHTQLPIVFTEIGWQSGAAPAPYGGTDEEQAAFVDRFRAMTASLPVVIEVWTYVYDQQAEQPFDTMGLRRADGSARPAWDRWVASS